MRGKRYGEREPEGGGFNSTSSLSTKQPFCFIFHYMCHFLSLWRQWRMLSPVLWQCSFVCYHFHCLLLHYSSCVYLASTVPPKSPQYQLWANLSITICARKPEFSFELENHDQLFFSYQRVELSVALFWAWGLKTNKTSLTQLGWFRIFRVVGFRFFSDNFGLICCYSTAPIAALSHILQTTTQFSTWTSSHYKLQWCSNLQSRLHWPQWSIKLQFCH